MTSSVICTGLAVFTCMGASGQTAAAPPAFEVASVKPSVPLPDGRIMRLNNSDPGTVDYKNYTLKILLARAYNVKEFQISGPDWIDSDGYDVVAKVPAGVAPDQISAMLQTLLAERFGIKLHKETRVLPVYVLSVGKGGPKLKDSDPTTIAAIQSLGRGGSAPPPPPAPGKGPPPGAIRIMNSPNGMTLDGSMDMSRLTMVLSNFMDRPVIDSTSLTGTYDINLNFMPDESFSLKGGRGMPPPPPPPAGDGSGRIGPPVTPDPVGNIFQALQSVGLKLESRKDPIETIVIDHANKAPTEN